MPVLPIYEYFVFNYGLKPVSEFIPHENEGGIYEVLRVESGVPLFFEEHMKRLYVSAEISAIKIEYSGNRIKNLLDRLITVNKVEFGNILISVKDDFNAFFIPHKYPDSFLYQSGIECGILNAERIKPNAKVYQTKVRKMADNLMNRKNLYEVLLVDHRGRITEGSRSNVFFINGDKIVTPPGNEVLLGVTRTKAIQVANIRGYKVAEEDVYLKDLTEFHAAFITGTSPKIMPVSQIDQVRFNPKNKILQLLIEGYDLLIESYIHDNRLET